MAKSNYNTFVIQECKSGRVLLVTSSARKAASMLCTGVRIEVWNCNSKVERITSNGSEKDLMRPYIDAEKEYIRNKQEARTCFRQNGRRL